MKTAKTMRRWAALTLLLAMLTGLMLPVRAAEGEAAVPKLNSTTPTSVEVIGVTGQEYVISAADEEPNWENAVEPDDDLVSFEDLIPATAYIISTRVKVAEGEEPGAVETLDLTTPLTGLSISSDSEDGYVVGAVLTVEPDPVDAKDLTYQWYYDKVTIVGEEEQHDLTPIDGATDKEYTIQAADAGKYLAVKAFKGEAEVSDFESLGPVKESEPAEDGTVAPEPSMWTPTDIVVRGVDGQEYVIAPKGSEPDWSKAVEPEDGFVDFEGLTPATTYTIYTRIKAPEGGEPGEVKTTDLTLSLIGLGVFSEDDYVPGAVFTVEADPADTEGLTYQWYYDDIYTVEEDVEMHNLTPIDGATATTYTIKKADVGKYLAVAAFKDGEEVGNINSLGPVTDGSAPDGYAYCLKDDTCPISKFTDADPTAWYHDGVHYVLDEGIMNGVGNDKFAPNDSCTRAMIVTMLWRMEGEPSADAAGFTDVEAGSWYEGAVNWAAANKIVEGYGNGIFGPTNNITREQFAAILYRYADYTGSKGDDFAVDMSMFTDLSSVSNWATDAMTWCVAAGIIGGVTDTTLVPQGEATRAQVATMLMRFSEQI